MKHRVGRVGICLVLISLLGMSFGYAGDLDDGISDFKDEPISADDKALETDTNLSFTIVDAISKSKSGQNKTGVVENNQNSIIVEAGATVTGPIVNIGGELTND